MGLESGVGFIGLWRKIGGFEPYTERSLRQRWLSQLEKAIIESTLRLYQANTERFQKADFATFPYLSAAFGLRELMVMREILEM